MLPLLASTSFVIFCKTLKRLQIKRQLIAGLSGINCFQPHNLLNLTIFRTLLVCSGMRLDAFGVSLGSNLVQRPLMVYSPKQSGIRLQNPGLVKGVHLITGSFPLPCSYRM